MEHVTIRLVPGQDLKKEIERLAAEREIGAGVVASAVGSLSKMTLRVADGRTVKAWEEPLEIVSATGTVSTAGCHVHISAANQAGEVFGGHLKEGCVVNTTAELVILALPGVRYARRPDSRTGYDELEIEPGQ